MPRIWLRVVWGFGVTMASFSPSIAFSRVDFPTLGSPIILTYPDLKEVSDTVLSTLSY